MTVSFVLSGQGNLTLLLNKQPYNVSPDHPNYKKILDGLEHMSEDELQTLTDVPASIAKFSKNKVTIVDGEIVYNGEVLHNTLAHRILDIMNQGLPFQPMILFLENLMLNPSSRAVSELYDFLENKNLPITEDGHFLAYKTVQSGTYRDFYSGTIDNSPGQIVEVPRNQVDDDRHHHCSHGLHVGALDYLNWYNPDGAFMIVKVNPRDCVSVPQDCGAMKLRVCRYEVLYEMETKERPLEETVYSSGGGEYDWDDDDNWDDQEESLNADYSLLEQETKYQIAEYAALTRDELVEEAHLSTGKSKTHFKTLGKRATIRELLELDCSTEEEVAVVHDVLKMYTDDDLSAKGK